MRLLIVGSGRSGTGYCAELLRAARVVCGHENVYTAPAVLGHEPVDWDGYAAEASWMAVPLLPWLPSDIRPALLVRHPLAVVQSLLELRFFAPATITSYHAVINRWTPATFTEATEHDRALLHWLSWNLAAAAHARPSRLESLTPLQVVGWLSDLGVPATLDAAAELLGTVPRDVNAKREDKSSPREVGWGMFRPPLAREALALARQLGYQDEPCGG